MSECTLCGGDPDVNCTRKGCRFAKDVVSENPPPLPKTENDKKINPNHPFEKAKKRLAKMFSRDKNRQNKGFKDNNYDKGFGMH